MSLAPFSFKREVFVKDLFRTKYLLNTFGEITFETFSSFLECLQNDFIRAGTRSLFRVRFEEKDMPSLISLLDSTDFVKEDEISLQIKPSMLKNEAFLDLLTKAHPFSIELDLDDIEVLDLELFLKKAVESFKNWISKNKVEVHVSIDADNYRNQINSIIEIYNKSVFRFFRVDFDYDSLNTMSFAEFDELRLRLQELTKTWGSSGSQNMKLDFSNKVFKRIYVDSNLVLYVNSYAKRDNTPILDLKDYPKDATGEDIDYKSLNIFRAYVDCPEYVLPFDESILTQKGLKHVIDPYFNKKMTRSYTMVPTITKSLLLALI